MFLLYLQRTIKRDIYARGRFYGIIIYMYISEHNPPHFHVYYNEYKAEITIEDGIITGTLPRRALHLVYEWLDDHKEELLVNWQRMREGKKPLHIEPLK